MLLLKPGNSNRKGRPSKFDLFVLTRFTPATFIKVFFINILSEQLTLMRRLTLLNLLPVQSVFLAKTLLSKYKIYKLGLSLMIHAIGYKKNWQILIIFNENWWNLTKCDEKWLNLIKLDEIWWDLIKFDEIWWDLMRFDEIWWNLMKFEEIWWNLMRFDEIWWNLMKFDKIWQTLTNVEDISQNSTNFDEIWWNLMRFNEIEWNRTKVYSLPVPVAAVFKPSDIRIWVDGSTTVLMPLSTIHFLCWKKFRQWHSTLLKV